MMDKDRRIAELEYQVNFYKKILSSAGFDIYDTNIKTGETTQSFHILSKLGYEPWEMDTFEKRNSAFNKEDLNKSLYHAHQIMSGESDQEVFEFRLIGKNGNQVWVKNYGTSIVNPITNERHFIGLLEDVTREKIYFNELIYKAHHDELTGIYNRSRGFERVKEVLETLNSVTDFLIVTYVDIDNLKVINDKFGHTMGDDIIKRFPEIMLNELKGEDVLFRVGGDEFIYVAFNRSEGELHEMLTRVLLKYKQSFDFSNDVHVGFSYGLTRFDHSTEQTIEEIVHASDLQMYLNKVEKRYDKKISYKPLTRG